MDFVFCYTYCWYANRKNSLLRCRYFAPVFSEIRECEPKGNMCLLISIWASYLSSYEIYSLIVGLGHHYHHTVCCGEGVKILANWDYVAISSEKCKMCNFLLDTEVSFNFLLLLHLHHNVAVKGGTAMHYFLYISMRLIFVLMQTLSLG